MAAVVITVVDGTVDYCIHGDVEVVLIDFDRHDPARAFPDDVDRDIAALERLPAMPWTRELCNRLRTLRKNIVNQIRLGEEG